MTTPSPLPRTTARDAGLCPDRLARLEAFFGEEVRRGRLPGAVMLVARDGAIAWTARVGALDPSGQAAMPEDAIFRIYSMTKPIVSVAVMMLAERAKLLLSDPLHQHLPEFAAQSVAVERAGGVERVDAASPITVQDLLRHTSGLTYEFVGDGAVHRMYAKAGVPSRDQDSAELSARLAQLPLAFHPGTRWEYSRATDVLGRLVETISGRTLARFLADEITGPLGMTDTAFHVASSEQHRIAEPFPTDPVSGASIRLIDVRRPPRLESGGGGMVGTVSDYARFLQMLLDGGALGGTRILGRKTVEWMTSDHLGDIPRDSPLLPRGYGFGLGFAVRTHAGMAPVPGSVGEYFWGGIAGTTFWVDPTERLFAILMIQAPGLRAYYRPLFRALVHASVL